MKKGADLPVGLEDLLFEQAHLQLAIRLAVIEEKGNSIKGFKSESARIDVATKKHYGELPAKVIRAVYLKFFKQQLRSYNKPDCYTCEHFPEDADDCLLHPGINDKISEQGIILCEDYVPSGKEKKEIKLIQQFIAELEPKRSPRIPPCMPGGG